MGVMVSEYDNKGVVIVQGLLVEHSLSLLPVDYGMILFCFCSET